MMSIFINIYNLAGSVLKALQVLPHLFHFISEETEAKGDEIIGPAPYSL